MKKNKLYMANRWNSPLFAQGVDRVHHNIFDGANSSTLNFSLTAPTISPYNSWMSPLQKAQANYQMQNPGAVAATTQQLSNFAPKENAVSNPFSFKEAFSKQGLKDGLKAGAGAAIGGLASAVGQIGGGLIGGGLESGAGSAISSIGGTVGSAVSAVNPILGGVISAGSGLIGGLTNRMFGTKVDQAKLNAANQGTAAYNSFQSNASSFDDITGPVAQANVQDAYSGGWFSSGKARRKNEALKAARREARQLAFRAVDNNVHNLVDDQMNNALANYSAFGGFLGDNDMSAVNYDLMSDYLTIKKKQAEEKNKMNNLFAGMPSGLFAFGGDMQTHGADFPSGLTHIDAGESHEENPNEGVQMGVDGEGVPNLVEEGETIYNDYVFSNRILADDATKQLFHIGKKRDVTFAELSKHLEKEISERVNDPISQAGFQKQMQMLEEQQERQKQEMEAERAKAAFEAMSPEEQAAVMQQTQEPEMMAAEGGKINRFDLGGNILNNLKIKTMSDFRKWAKENGFTWAEGSEPETIDDVDWESLLENDTFRKAISKDNPALADALEKGYDFGTFQPSKSTRATIQSISKGNWKTTNGKGWRGSEDLAFKQATQGMSDEEIDALTTEQLAERMKNTEAYKNTNKWLENSDNALMYLNTLLNDPDTPQVAKDYAAKFVKDGKWKDGFTYDYGTVFGKDGKGVRETNPGTYWHTAMEANRGNQAGNFVINEDGSVEPIIGDVPTDWTSAGNYAWADEDNDYAYNYYKRPVVASPSSTPPAEEETPAEETPAKDEQKNQDPRHRAEWLRYAGLFGPAVGLGLMGLGVGKPDTAQLDAAIEGAGDVTPAQWKPLGNYLTYRPLDIWYEQNALNAQSRATDRALMNTSGGNRGTAMAGLLANGYNSQLASGNLFRQAQEYNDKLRKDVAEFNRGTDQFNSEQFGATSRFNADAYNQARRANAQLRLQAAREKMDADAGWYNSLYGNISGLFKGLGDIGTENYRMNRISEMAADGIFGNLGKSNTGKKHVKSKGGKVKKGKRGLTF